MDEKLHNSKKSELTKFLFQFYSLISRGKLDAARNVNFHVKHNEGKVGVPETNLERIVLQLKNATLHLARGKVQKALNEFQQVKDSLQLLTLLLGFHKSRMRIKLGKDDIALLYLEATLGIVETTFRCGKLEMTWQDILKRCSETIGLAILEALTVDEIKTLPCQHDYQFFAGVLGCA